MQDISPQDLERRVNRWLAKVVGGVLLWFGVAAVGLFFWAIYKIASFGEMPPWKIYLLIAGLAITGIFCLSVGWRLFLDRPNRYGSSLTPMSWRILGTMFGLLGAAFIAFTWAFASDAQPDFLSSIAASVASVCLLSYCCFRLARQLAMRTAERK
jgi:hypothetical protein